MSRLRFSYPKNVVPPDNLRYVHSDGFVTVASDTASWYAKIEKHEQDNGRTLPPDWKEDAQDKLCRLLPPGWCTYENGETTSTYVDTRFGRDDFVRGMAVLTQIALNPDPLVAQEEAEERASVCASCPANVLIEGCAPCLKAGDMVAAIRGAASTTSDPLLKGCAICHCSNSAQVWIKPELLAKGVNEEQKQQFLQVGDWCWKAKALWPTEVPS